MDDLISRQAAIDAVEKWFLNLDDNKMPEEVLSEVPSVQPERKKGKWKSITRPFDGYRCSECDKLLYGKTNYCPNCGADMRGEK